ncbi:MAG TPA: hypothetical protein VFG59_05580 [Anaeromyxobacter sp.]|nr:hypothetical protein [Anaeromyxobacter sp.]
MRLEERVRIAQFAYARAVAVARAESTRHSWGRLLAAAKNLREARRDRERERGGRPGGLAGGGAPGPAGAASDPRRSAVLALPLAHEAPSPAPELSSSLAKELDRSRALRTMSFALIAEARTLCAELGRLGEGRRKAVGVKA